MMPVVDGDSFAPGGQIDVRGRMNSPQQGWAWWFVVGANSFALQWLRSEPESGDMLWQGGAR